VRLIRRFEERAVQLVRGGDIVGGIHPYTGQEAIAAGVCAALAPTDMIASTHRGHGHVLAKGADPARMMAELTGRLGGLNKGRGGSMHAADLSLGVLGANGIVGAGAPIATGAAWAAARLAAASGGSAGSGGSLRVAVSFFGDGAVNQGVLLETFNLASLWRVPVVFVCEKNGYATTLTVADAVAGSVTARAEAFGIPALSIDGMDPATVLAAADDAVGRARRGDGPSFLECHTYRFDAHHTWEHRARPRYRSESQVATGRLRDPVDIAASRLTAAVRDAIDADVERTLDDAVAFALSSPPPDPVDAAEFLYASGLRARPGTV
jgi:pyruvate dehydrogenase E1 component alpha subunit